MTGIDASIVPLGEAGPGDDEVDDRAEKPEETSSATTEGGIREPAPVARRALYVTPLLGSPSAGAGAWPVAHFLGCIFLASCGSGPPPPPKPPPEAPMVTDPLAKILASMDPGSRRSLPVPTRRDDLVEKLFGHAVADPYRWLEDGDSEEVKRWTDEQNALTRRVLDRIAVREKLHARLTELLQIGTVGVPAVRKIGASTSATSTRGAKGDQNQPILYVRDGVDGTTRCSSIPTARRRTARRSRLVVPARTTATARVRALAKRRRREHALPARRRQRRKISPTQIERTPLRVDRLAARRQELLLLALSREGHACRPGEENYHRTRLPARVGRRSREGRLRLRRRSQDDRLAGRRPLARRTLARRERARRVGEERALSPRSLRQGKTRSCRWSTGVEAHLRPDAFATTSSTSAPTTARRATSSTRSIRKKPERAAMERDPRRERRRARRRDGRGRAISSRPTCTMPRRASGAFTQDRQAEGRGGAADHWLERRRLRAMGRRRGVLRFLVLRRAAHDLSPRSRRSGQIEKWEPSQAPIDPGAVRGRARFTRTSKDGTQVPMFVIHKKGLEKDGKTPRRSSPATADSTSTSSPSFTRSSYLLARTRRHSRGRQSARRGRVRRGVAPGGMLEQQAKRVRRLPSPQRASSSSSGYTDPAHLGVMGGSNGGLSVGALVTQRPDLFRAAVCSVPLLDMAALPPLPHREAMDSRVRLGRRRKHSSGSTRIRPITTSSTGTPYPAVLFTTAESDSRVDPLHARKMAARCKRPRRRSTPSCCASRPRRGTAQASRWPKLVEEMTDVYGFLFAELDVSPP